MKLSYLKIAFWFLTLITLCQILWWAYLLNYHHAMIIKLNPTLLGLQDYSGFKKMILIESMFFLIIWLACLYFSYRAFQKEVQIQKTQSSFLTILSFPTSCQSISLNQIVKECVEQIKTFRNTHNLEIDVEFNQDYIIKTSPLESKLILKNILENVAQYSTSNNKFGKIKITAERLAKKISLVIKDNGIGMGIDLTLAQQLSKKAGLQILLENNRINHGTTTRLFWERDFL